MSRTFLTVAIAATVLFTLCALDTAAQPKKFVASTINIASSESGGHVIAVSDEAVDENGHVMEHWAADNAIDGLHVRGNYTPPNSYGWSTNTPPSHENPHWIVLAFDKEPKTHLISRIVIDPVTDNPGIIGRWVRDIEVQVSVTNPQGPYRTVSRHLVENKAIKQAFDCPPHECRYLRLVINGNHGSDKCVELGEIEVYEAIVGDDYIDGLIIRLENLLQDLKEYRDGAYYQEKRARLQEVTRKEPPPEETTQPTAASDEQQDRDTSASSAPADSAANAGEPEAPPDQGDTE
jgi:hypothetical protein